MKKAKKRQDLLRSFLLRFNVPKENAILEFNKLALSHLSFFLILPISLLMGSFYISSIAILSFGRLTQVLLPHET